MQRFIIYISNSVKYVSLSKRDYAILVLIILFGLFLRLYPGQDHFIWSYDQARDSVVIRTILGERNIIITGPQTEYVGLSHGPLYYYLVAPFYHYAQANPNIPLGAMMVLNLSTIVPLVLLTQLLFKDRRISLLAGLIFAVAYQQVEYARWLSNVSVAIPLLAWAYYFLWQTLTQNRRALFAGLCIGLAMQAEFFLIFLLAVSYLLFYFYKTSWKSVFKYHLGFALGASSYIISELKFNFIGTKTFLSEFMGGHTNSTVPASLSFTKYLDHLGLTTQQNIFGITPAMGLLALFGMLLLLLVYKKQIVTARYVPQILFILVLLFAHSLLVTFHFIDAVFLNLTFIVPVVILAAFCCVLLYSEGYKWATYLLIIGILGTQLLQLGTNTASARPFQLYNFHQSAILFSQKKEMVHKIYEAAEGMEFTLGVLGTPYGVQTVWATIFENYLSENPGYYKPHWYGFQALGYPSDSYFTKVDHPGPRHILIIEDISSGLLSEFVYYEYMQVVNESTAIIDEHELYGFTIQVREPKKKLATPVGAALESEK